ncbi:unnamed protein product [Phaedon cochleariae]|uniref:Mitochondrial ribosomal protein S30 n=1 Tax=Phaedon cochleariae TaxID=80249 RepID=A0A9N9X2G4_PHACE|nr:unnamed protein product [Phaedon cochleariae]
MSLFRIKTSIPPRLFHCRCFATALPNDEEYTATPHYPPILDMSFEKKLERKKVAKHEEIKAVKTVEEKQIKLNMPRFYGFKSYMLNEDYCPYNNLGLAQHVTRTHLIVNNELPEYYKNIDVSGVALNLKSEIEEAIAVEIDGYKRENDFTNDDLTKVEMENLTSSLIVKQLNRIIKNEMSTSHPHMKNAQIDYEPRIESTWLAGGMDAPERVKSVRRGRPWTKHMEDDPVDRLMVFVGSPCMTVRSELPLPPIVSRDEAENAELEVPFFRLDPRAVGNKTEFRHIANTPGFWPGDPHKFGLLSYHNRGYLHNRKHYQDPQDDKEAVHRQAIIASFGWLQAQANFLGFNTYNDITYPLVTQTVITDGKVWSFYAYQLNTIVFHTMYVNENPKRNICWGTEELNLYDRVENGKLEGFNDQVLELLLKFYCNVPESRLGINLTPYLNHEEKVIADYADDDKRQWLEREYKFLVSNRPRFKLDYEVYSWEKIYKIDNKTRHMDKKLRPFELLQDPFKRTLDDRQPIYIPRKFRPHLPRHKGKYAKEYFP